MNLQLNTTNCKYCGKEFERFGIAKKFCSQNCVIEKHKSVLREKQEGIEGVDYIICHLCNSKVQRIYGKHLNKFHKISSEEYKQMFPFAQLCCNKDLQHTSINSGLHMKEEKYRQMVSKQMMGENNINSKTKTDEITRQGRSPFSQVFYERLNKPAEDRAIFVKRALKDRIAFWELQYFINKGMSEEEAKIFRKSKKFSLVYCINKYGEEVGHKVWKERQDKWKSKVFNESTYIGNGTSNVSNMFITEVLKYNDKNDHILHGKNEKSIYDKKNRRAYKYDLTNLSNKRVIEFNGVYWHCKPELYESTYFNKVKKQTAAEIQKYDEIKYELLKIYDYELLVIWEDEYKQNPEEIIKKCVDFIYEK